MVVVTVRVVMVNTGDGKVRMVAVVVVIVTEMAVMSNSKKCKYYSC